MTRSGIESRLRWSRMRSDAAPTVPEHGATTARPNPRKGSGRPSHGRARRLRFDDGRISSSTAAKSKAYV